MPENDLKNIKEIFEKAKNGNKKAFSEIYEAYFKPLYCYVRLKIGDKAESDDLVQDIFISALNYKEDSDLDLSSLSPTVFFYSVARLSISDWKRKRRRVKSSLLEDGENYYEIKTDRNEDDLSREEFDNLSKALEELSDEEQDAVIFKFISNLSNEDVRFLLNVSARSARRLETQGLISIRDILKQQYEQQS